VPSWYLLLQKDNFVSYSGCLGGHLINWKGTVSQNKIFIDLKKKKK
jgi:hypothetical protein